ncbi:type II toxin-antitoxin system HipA family toxin [Pseudokordiimonas caeni]|uniref:type II toxin-antitoxin system HipA family toxin n=1 Tax=Pseudokordiimonas caeni TaxID=2997908 RepID=UPI002811A6F3|nr:HipA domain-containing protein [Pseudokordiimonas caeni]
MAKLRYGNVTFKGRLAGILSETAIGSGGTEFVYADDAPEIACALPRETRVHRWASGIHPVFAHLAPEGWLRNRQAAVADADTEDDFGLLLAFGADCIGAIGIEDPEHHGQDFTLTEGATEETRAIAAGHRTISGVQAKLLCEKAGDRYEPAGRDDAAPIIAKFARDDLADLVGNEAVSLELVRILLPKDEVATFRRGMVARVDRPALLVDRFDRAGTNHRQKLRCEDFAQVLAIPPGRDRKAKYQVSYDRLADALRYSAAPAIDAFILYKRLVAFCLIGNTDCHLKNWSLLETSRGLRLSPIYDVLNGYIYGREGYSTRFGLLDRGNEVQWEDYDRDRLIEVGRAIGLTPKAIERAFKEIATTEEAVKTRLQGSLYLGEERTTDYRTSVLQKWEQIYG